MRSTDQLDRVRDHTAADVNREIDEEMQMRVRCYAEGDPSAIDERIESLEREWDVERALEMNASSLAFAGLALGAFVNRKWLFLPGLVLPFLFQHATQGWCPPLPVMRRMGFRTRSEIDREKYALKALRGDFEGAATPDRAIAASQA